MIWQLYKILYDIELILKFEHIVYTENGIQMFVLAHDTHAK